MMKKSILLFSLSIFSCVLFAQDGISFTTGSWSKILAKAKQENKLIFVDVATSWCGPCKKMAADVFPQKEVGNVFNTAFVNYQIDAEKGEGRNIAKQYSVTAFPTFLFIKSDGVLINRAVGFLQPDNFIAEAKSAINENENAVPFANWENDYATGNRKMEFLIEYLKKRAALKMPSAEVIEEVFPRLSPEDLKDKELVSSLLYFNYDVQYLPKGKLYEYVVGNHVALDSFVDGPSLSILQMGVLNYFYKNIVPNGKLDMLPVMLDATKELSSLLNSGNSTLSSKALVMQYYSGTHNAPELIKAARDYVINGIYSQNIDSIKRADSFDFEQFMNPFFSGGQDSTKVQNWELMVRLNSHKRMLNISYYLRGAAEAIYKNVDDTAVLKQAAEWAKVADSWFSHFSSKAVYAGLLFKSGSQQEAITIMMEASQDLIIQGGDKQKLLSANAEKIKNGEAPKELW
jgi:thioredoxin-related protein